MAFQPRGGFPDVLRVSAPAAPAAPIDPVAKAAEVLAATHQFAAPTVHLRVKTSTASVKIYFALADFLADEKYVLLTTADVFSEPVEARKVWLSGSGGTAAVELLAICKG